MIYTLENIQELEHRFRTTFINSLAGFRQAVLVGTKSANNQENLAIFNSLIHLGAHPALYGLIIRPDSVQRDTLQNILETQQYTFNFVKGDQYQKTHQTSARYDFGISEFDQVGFTPIYHKNIQAPFVQEAVVKIAMKFEQRIDIPLNGTCLIIGSVQQVALDEKLIDTDGYIDLANAQTLITQGLDAYFTANSLGRMPYAKAK